MTDAHAAGPKVVLVGPPGAGKSTIGRRLSRALSCPFIDTDAAIEAAEGMSCGDIIRQRGEAEFRVLEAAHVAKSLQQAGVISLGGGAVLTESTRTLLNDITVVYLDLSARAGVERTSKNDSRPLLQTADGEDPVAKYQAMLDKRKAFYNEVSDFRIRTEGKSPQQNVGEILGFLDA